MTIIKVLSPVTLCFLDQWGQFILLPAARAEHRFCWRLIRFQSGPTALCHLSSAVTSDGGMPFCLAAFNPFLSPESASPVCTAGWADESVWQVLRSRASRVRLPGPIPALLLAALWPWASDLTSLSLSSLPVKWESHRIIVIIKEGKVGRAWGTQCKLAII